MFQPNWPILHVIHQPFWNRTIQRSLLRGCGTSILCKHLFLLFSRNVLKAGEKIQRDYESGQAQEVVFNKNMVALVRAAKVHTRFSPLHDWYFLY